MKQGSELIDQQLKSLQTPAGQTASKSTSTTQTSSHEPVKGHRQDNPEGDHSGANSAELKQQYRYAINGLFTLLEDAYPLKFRRAFPTDEDLSRAKRVWYQSLREFSPRRIIQAGQKALDTTKFFPDLSEIRELCKLRYDEMGLKEPLQAYYEACFAPQQTREYRWSHIAVYLAARETGWITLRSEEQRVAFPIFERNYNIVCNRVLDGEDLEASIMKGIEDSRSKEAVRVADEQAEQSLRKEMEKQGIDPDSGRTAFEKLKQSLTGSQ
ncbi:replication protein P [Endozoicomonas numazuensis]|uniref:replication protein P n=1 Tax=Endozoicomonas numazuensis TaxID=1137799 RepID=UPI00068EC77E|nr:replication protein P [Endozoicomonas numazuensis]